MSGLIVSYDRAPGAILVTTGMGPKNAKVTVLPGYGSAHMPERSKWTVSRRLLNPESGDPAYEAAAKVLSHEEQAAAMARPHIALGDIVSHNNQPGAIFLVTSVGPKTGPANQGPVTAVQQTVSGSCCRVGWNVAYPQEPVLCTCARGS